MHIKVDRMNKLKHTLLIAICVALASQFNLSYFVKGFIITLSVVLLPIFLYNYAELNPIIGACYELFPLYLEELLYNWILKT